MTESTSAQQIEDFPDIEPNVVSDPVIGLVTMPAGHYRLATWVYVGLAALAIALPVGYTLGIGPFLAIFSVMCIGLGLLARYRAAAKAAKTFAQDPIPDNEPIEDALRDLFDIEWHPFSRSLVTRPFAKTALRTLGRRLYNEGLCGKVFILTPDKIRHPETVELVPVSFTPTAIDNPYKWIVNSARIALIFYFFVYWMWSNNPMPSMKHLLPLFLFNMAQILGEKRLKPWLEKDPFGRSRCFAVPGGLVFRRTAAFQGKWKTRLLTAKDAILFYSTESEKLAAVSQDGNCYIADVPPKGFGAALHAWHSKLKPPSADALCDLE